MKLPAILSGPIVRRVEKKQAFIWVATSEPYEITTVLYQILRGSGKKHFQYQALPHHTSTKTIRFGENLYLHLIQLIPDEALFPTQTLIGYNLYFSDGEETVDLGSFDLLNPKNPDSIVYGGLKYPTFFINEGPRNRTLYGSCRKPHGEGNDALAIGDDVLWETYLSLEERPSALYLLGDQIYADDIPGTLAPFLFSLGKVLVGESKKTLSKIEPRLSENPYQQQLYKINGRKTIMNDLCHFTSRKSDNHLITLGEYAAMYLLSFGPQLWENINKELFEQFLEGKEYFIPTNLTDDLDSIANYTLGRQDAKYNEQLVQIEQFQNSLPQVRRLLANTPTYMMFDDHDVTDDWNISYDWKQHVWESPLGRHVVSTALTAYWGFQGWGNNPTAYDKSFLKSVRKYVGSLKPEGKTYKKWIKTMWQFDSWSFIAPTNPKTVFLDTRTQRHYSLPTEGKSIRKQIKQEIEGPELLSESAWNKVTQQLVESGWKSGTALIVISPVPFYGIDLVETFLHRFVSPLRLVGLPVKTFFDMEAWKYSGRGFTRFLKTIAHWNPSACIILSGDAHTASSTVSHIRHDDQQQATLIQFTSSPLKNPTFAGFPGALLKGAVWLFEKSSGTRTIYRSCDPNFSLYQSTGRAQTLKTKNLWSESIQYLPMENGTLLKTNNNLGLLSLNGATEINNKFLEDN
ncbi:alkaline phosphatase D family protein [Mesobacillus maritimus]|uniref:alkaline phosphatase D family protein n=1 Tax=Mesobacillus maritimus TaxID=1643336 RepID=UPI00203C0A11|nr:alkaline phosphatase D family protein [Mesobacillus maritimus]MCM3585937.1 alkaline phosphatase D family protein [Mesobacillus maritimus]